MFNVQYGIKQNHCVLAYSQSSLCPGPARSSCSSCFSVPVPAGGPCSVVCPDLLGPGPCRPGPAIPISLFFSILTQHRSI